MTRLLAWRDEWSLGIDALDEDHRTLVETLVDITLRYCPQATAAVALPAGARASAALVRFGPAPIALVEALTAFGDKVRAHCRREEAFMRAIGYTQSKQHEAQHTVLMAQFDAMVDDCRRRGVKVFDTLGQEWMRDWLLGHIVDGDRDFARVYFALCGLERTADWPEDGPILATLRK